MSTIAIISQANYEPASLQKAIKRAIALVGFDLGQVRGKQVLLKPNLLGAYPPERAVTTNPEFVCAAAKIFIEAGAHVVVGDSPEAVYTVEDTWNTTGIRKAVSDAGASEIRFEASGSTLINGYQISRAVAGADIVINLPKFKTHGLTIMTLAAKNLFGCISGMMKCRLHEIHKKRADFSEMIAKIADAVRPELTIIDGIIGMSGNGPSAGNAVNLNMIIAGTNVHDIDATCCKIIGLAPLELDTLAAAKRLGFWDDKKETTVVGDFEILGTCTFPEVRVPRISNFELPSTYTRGLRDMWIVKFAADRFWKGLTAQPKIAPDRCKVCLLCIGSCPVAAITQSGISQAPKIDKKMCIQCLCCHEACPHRAIDLKVSLLVRLIRRLS